MDDYISREAVVRYLKGFSEKELNSKGNFGMITSSVLDKAERAISEMPAADVQPVKHGRWELISQNKFTGTKTLRCTYCKNYFVVRDDTLNAGRGDANFCPNCGSENRMDGDNE